MIYDGTKSIAGNRLYLTSLQTVWELINAGSLAKLKPLIAPYAHGLLWDPGMVTILAAPAWSVLGVVGILFVLLGLPEGKAADRLRAVEPAGNGALAPA